MYTAEVESFTHKTKNQVIVSRKFLSEGDRVLIIDDFLANGRALQGLIQIVQAAGGQVEGIGIAVEKGISAGRPDYQKSGLSAGVSCDCRRYGSYNRRNYIQRAVERAGVLLSFAKQNA